MALKNALFVSAIVASSLLEGSSSPDGYSHGRTGCLQGINGQGVRLRLTQHRHCEGQVSRPYLEINLRELPISANKRIVIGDANSALRCQDPKRSCEQSLSGEVMFNDFEELSDREIQTDGWYELRFGTGLPETGRFKVDCMEPCG